MDITLINIYTPNMGAHKYIKQIETDINGENDNNTIVGNFNAPLTSMDRSSRQKINKETVVLKDTLDQLDLIDIHRHPLKNTEYTFFQVRMECYLE